MARTDEIQKLWRERKKKMIVEFSKEASACAYFMVCNPARFWTPATWWRDKSSTGEVISTRLHGWIERHCRLPEEYVEGEGEKAQTVKRSEEARLFVAGKFSLQKELVNKLLEHYEHYRNLVPDQKHHIKTMMGAPVQAPQDALNQVNFGDLKRALDGHPIPDEHDGEEPEDLAILANQNQKASPAAK